MHVDRRDFIAQGAIAAAAGMVAGLDLLNGNEAKAWAKSMEVEGSQNLTELLLEAGLEFAPPQPHKDVEIGEAWTAIWTDPETVRPAVDDVCKACHNACEKLARQALYMVLRDGPGTWKTLTTPTIVTNPYAYHIGQRDRAVEFHAFIHIGKEKPDETWLHRRVLRSVRTPGRDSRMATSYRGG